MSKKNKKSVSERDKQTDTICGVLLLILSIFSLATAPVRSSSEAIGRVLGTFIVYYLIYYLVSGSKYWKKLKDKLDISLEREKEPKENPVSLWLRVISIGIVVLLFLIFYDVSALFIGFFGYIFGMKSSELACKIKKNPDIAYVIGFVFSLIGFIGYWIYYRIEKKKVKK